MTLANLIKRIRFAIAVMTGRLRLPRTVEEMELDMAFEQLNQLVSEASAAADRLIAKSQSDASALADAQSQIANLETDAVAALQPLHDKLVDAAPDAPTTAGDAAVVQE